MCGWGEERCQRRGGGGEEEFKTFRENKSASSERAVPGTRIVCPTSLLSPQNHTKMHFATKSKLARHGFFFLSIRGK